VVEYSARRPRCQVRLGLAGRIRAVRDVLARQPVGVLVRAAFPWECRPQKQTEMPVATVNLAWAAISMPWSRVSVRRRSSGRCSISAASRAATRSAVLIVGHPHQLQLGGPARPEPAGTGPGRWSRTAPHRLAVVMVDPQPAGDLLRWPAGR